jgi:hypothetical protein
MKSVTISLSEQEIENWKEAAWRERKTLSAWVRERCEWKEDKKARSQESIAKPKQEDKKAGVQVSMSVPVNTEVAAKERLSEMTKGRMNTGESDAEFLRRQEAATKSMEKRYGSK